MVASQLVGDETYQMMEAMQMIMRNRARENDYEQRSMNDDDNKLQTDITQEDDTSKANPSEADFDGTKAEIFNDLNEIKVEINEGKAIIKAECNEECLKPHCGKGEKGSFKMDKRSLTKTLQLGSCKCPVCKKEFNITNLQTEKLYRRHLYVHRVKKFDCKCQKICESEKELKLHIYNSHRGNFHCDSCRQTFQSEDLYKEHLEGHSQKEPFICADCGYTSVSETSLYSHVKLKHDKNIQVCDICSKEFNGTLKLKIHLRRFHAEKKPCPHCGEMIKNMWLHLKTMHTKDSDKKYQCDLCGKGFVEMRSLEKHKMSVHIKARPYACRFGCGAASNDKGNRKKHEISQHGQAFQETEGDIHDNEYV